MGLKKQIIINTSIDLFADNGIKAVSIIRIADEVGASRGMIYHYFRKGKYDIIGAILQVFEDSISRNIPDPKEWESQNADAEQILSKLVYQFSPNDEHQLRKIVRIILSEMFFDKQIARYAADYFIAGRERLLSDCFLALAKNGKIAPLDAGSAARFLNRLMIVYAIEDALHYSGEDIGEEQMKMVVRDFKHFIDYILSGN